MFQRVVETPRDREQCSPDTWSRTRINDASVPDRPRRERSKRHATEEGCVCEIRRLRISFRLSLESSESYGTETLPSFTGDRSPRSCRHEQRLRSSAARASVLTIEQRPERSGTSRTVVHSLGRASVFRGHQSLSRLLRLGVRPLDRLRCDRQRTVVPFVLNDTTVGTTIYSRIKLTCLTTV